MPYFAPPHVDSDDEVMEDEEDEEDPGSDTSEDTNPLKRFQHDEGAQGDGPLSEMEMVVMILDWMAVYKVPDETANDMWARVKAMLGQDVAAVKFSSAKAIVKKFHEESVEVVELCINDCIAFVDCPNLKDLVYMYSHRDKCPKCGEKRWLVDPKTKKMCARKVVYYRSLDSYLRSLFNQPELVSYLWNDAGR